MSHVRVSSIPDGGKVTPAKLAHNFIAIVIHVSNLYRVIPTCHVNVASLLLCTSLIFFFILFVFRRKIGNIDLSLGLDDVSSLLSLVC
jgi:hypothetical protein